MNPRKLSSTTLFPFVLLFACSLYSCNSGNSNSSLSEIFNSDFVDAEAFKTSIQSSLKSINVNDSTFQKQLLKDSDGVINTSYAYRLSDYQPLWFDKSGIKQDASALLDQLRLLQEDGLDTNKYQISILASQIGLLKGQKSCPLDTVMALDKTLTKTWLIAAKDLLLGTIEIKKGDSLWFAGNDTSFNGARILADALKSNSPLPSLDTFRTNANVYFQMKKALKQWQSLKNDTAYLAMKRNVSALDDGSLTDLLKKELVDIQIPVANDSAGSTKGWIATYQYYHQLKNTGKLDSATRISLKKMPDAYIATIKMNMDRIRALPRDIKTEHLWVTIPLMEVEYVKNEQVLFHSKVVVGKPTRQTPSLWANLTNVVFNPPWGVPPTILKNDVGPGVGRSGSAYLGKKGLRAFDSKGKDVTDQVNASNYKRYNYRQPPGAGNSLGEVKFNLPNRWDIYLHDTPHRENFANTYRALSSGCVRVQNPKALAEILLDSDKFTADKIDTIIATRKTKFEKIERKLPVYIIYATIAPDSTGSQLRYLNDIYRRDERMLKYYPGS
jgi:murein L,D-transpeptidase YcbB/YkuD